MKTLNKSSDSKIIVNDRIDIGGCIKYQWIII